MNHALLQDGPAAQSTGHGQPRSSSMNDCISSVRVPEGWTETLYEHADFTGAQVTLDADIREVGGNLHDKASAIVVAEPQKEPAYYFGPDSGDDWFYFEDSTTV